MSILEIYNPFLHPDGFWHSLSMEEPRDMEARDPQQIWNGQIRAVSGLASALNVVLLGMPSWATHYLIPTGHQSTRAAPGSAS